MKGSVGLVRDFGLVFLQSWCQTFSFIIFNPPFIGFI